MKSHYYRILRYMMKPYTRGIFVNGNWQLISRGAAWRYPVSAVSMSWLQDNGYVAKGKNNVTITALGKEAVSHNTHK